jgi:hypothetical protein
MQIRQSGAFIAPRHAKQALIYGAAEIRPGCAAQRAANCAKRTRQLPANHLADGGEH